VSFTEPSRPDPWCVLQPVGYGRLRSVTPGRPSVSVSNAPVPIATAAEQAGVDIAQIHRWAEVGGLQVQGRGGKEFVRLDQVLALSAASRRRDPSTNRGALRARLADARIANPSVAGLQQALRDRGTGRA
jgi:hypothetical protein